MLDPGSGGGGQISHLISADGKSPKGLLCHLHSVDILCERLCGCLLGIEMLSGAKLNFLTYHSLLFSPLSLPPSLPLFSSPLSLSYPPPHVRNARSRLEFFFSTSLSSSSVFQCAVSLSFPCSSLPPCSDLFSFVRQSSFCTLSQLIAAYVSERESYVHVKGRAVCVCLSGNKLSQTAVIKGFDFVYL